MTDDAEVLDATTVSALDSAQDLTEEWDVPCALLTGRAGTGKTTELRRRCAERDDYGILAATTGIAAVNINATTINSLLGYFDTASLRDIYLTGTLARKLHDLALEYEWLMWDEISMADAEQLDLVYRGVQEANRYRDIKRAMGLLLCGDFCQLPPIKAKFAFEAACWPRFAENITRLDHIWRQDELPFLNALNLIRSGRGSDGAAALDAAGVRWETQLDTEFDGTTIIPKNDQVERFNQIALDRVTGAKLVVASRRWGKLRKEWDLVPQQLQLKVGAYVMILANAPGFEYVNGDCAHVLGYVPKKVTKEGTTGDYFLVRLVRTNQEAKIPRVVRDVGMRERPDGWSGTAISKAMDDGAYIPQPHYRGQKKRYVMGQLEYFPLQLGYASTVHKSQGLTLDRCQIDFRNPFFSSPGMAYVAISRCRSLGGLRMVGQREVFAKRVNIDARVREWL